ncbi:hypothetical protein CW705_05740 [Candidatus Bathyarchaeota archaeon]|nr:MAG: hypothetical protein CW705_05740 [Candidatus Bathyarchaeota archaeon]
MPAHSKFEEKIDVLDLIINVLRDHEENLSRTLENFDDVHQRISAFAEKLNLLDKILERLDGLKVKRIIEATGINGPLVKVKCNDWATFRAASQGALLVTFEISEGNVTVSSITDLFVFIYNDGIPELMSVMGSGIMRWVSKIMKNGESAVESFDLLHFQDDIYEEVIDPEAFRNWLSTDLKISKEKIIHGKVLC